MRLTFNSDEELERVDAWIAAKNKELSRSFIKKIAQEGGLTINGKIAKCSERLKKGDLIELLVPEPQTLQLKPQNIEIEVLYEDEDIIVVNKPRGMVVHPAAGNYEGTLVNALLAKYGDKLSSINGIIRPGIVHRIDKDTTGVLVVARNNMAHERLSALFKEHDMKRTYIALLDGEVKEERGTVDAPVGRHPVDRKRMAVNTKNGRRAVTHFRVLQRFHGATMIEATLETGRTHQIRVHMAHIGYPVASDPVYGRKKSIAHVEGQLLHAQVLGFVHPRSGEYVEFRAELPKDFQEVLKRLT